MKTKHLFWGILFISIGLLWMLDHFMQMFIDWNYTWKLWPVVIILWGASLMIRNQVAKGIVVGLTAFILALALFTSVRYGCHQVGHDMEWTINDDNDGYKYTTNEFSEPYNNTYTKATLNFNAGGGSFIAHDTTTELFFARAEGKKDNYSLSKNVSGDNVELNFDMNQGHIRFFHFNKMKNRIDLKLNTEPLWDLNFDLGAASVDFDLSPYKTEKISIDMGAASLKLKLGDRAEQTNLSVDAGASSIEISLPEEAGCEIKTDISLSSKHIEGFKNIESDLYRTDNFDNAKKKIYISIDSGVSSIKITRYAKPSV